MLTRLRHTLISAFCCDFVMNLHSYITRFFKTYYLALLVMLLCLILHAFETAPILRYAKPELQNGEVWRLISAHFVHLTWAHLGMNMGALGLIWLMFAQRYSSLEWLFVIVFSSLYLSLYMYFFDAKIHYFVGFSGTIHGIMIAGCLREWKYDRLIAVSAIVLTSAKLGWEQIYGALPGSAETAGGPVLVDSHLYGAIGGVVAFALITLYSKLHFNQRT